MALACGLNWSPTVCFVAMRISLPNWFPSQPCACSPCAWPPSFLYACRHTDCRDCWLPSRSATRHVLPAPSVGADNVTLQVHVAANLNAVSSVAVLVMTGLAGQGGQEVELEAQAEGGQHDAGADMDERTLR